MYIGQKRLALLFGHDQRHFVLRIGWESFLDSNLFKLRNLLLPAHCSLQNCNYLIVIKSIQAVNAFTPTVGVALKMIAERFGRLDEGMVDSDCRAIREDKGGTDDIIVII